MPDESQESTQTGKLARLPYSIREQVHRRLQDGQSAREIITWLNRLPLVEKRLTELFNAEPISDTNFSNWRKIAHPEWVKRRARTEATRELARQSIALARAGGATLSDGAAAIAAGKITRVLDGLSDENEAPEKLLATLADITKVLTPLRIGDHSRERIGQEEKKIGQRDESLKIERQKLQRGQVTDFLDWYKDEKVRATADRSDLQAEEQIQILGKHIFGDMWKPVAVEVTRLQ